MPINNNKVFSIFDSKSLLYKTPFLMRTTGEAVRAFADISNDKTTEIGKHPEYFIMYQIAEYDDETGLYKQDTHICLGKAIEFVKSTEA